VSAADKVNRTAAGLRALADGVKPPDHPTPADSADLCPRCGEQIAPVEDAGDGMATWTGCACHSEWLARLDWITADTEGASVHSLSAGHRSLQAELDELERTDPDVRAAAESYDRMVEKITGRNWRKD
jgi:hypothetical protein